jgi:hypothetical protein
VCKKTEGHPKIIKYMLQVKKLIGIIARRQRLIKYIIAKRVKYLIYSHISPEILDKIWPTFYEFKLYAVHKKTFSKMYQTHFMDFSEHFYSQK